MFKLLPTVPHFGDGYSRWMGKKKNLETLVSSNDGTFEDGYRNLRPHNAQKKMKRHVAEWAEWDEQLSSSYDTR